MTSTQLKKKLKKSSSKTIEPRYISTPTDCVLLKIGDKNYFTDKFNFSILKEFANIHKLQMSVVKANNIRLLSIVELVDSISNDRPPELKQDFSIAKATNDEKNVRKQAKVIRSYIYNILSSGEEISLGKIKGQFDNLNLSDSCYSNHIKTVTKRLTKEGKIIKGARHGRQIVYSIKE